MINDIKGLTDTAIYSFAYNLSMIMLVAATGINKAFLPSFMQLKNDNNNHCIHQQIKKDSQLLCIICCFYIVIVGCFFPLFPVEYKQSLSIFLLLTFNYLLFHGYTIYSNYLFYKGKTIKIFLNTFLSGIINVILNYFLITKYSYIGATFSTLISFFILLFLYYKSAKREDETVFPISIFLKNYLITIIFFIPYYISSPFYIIRILWLFIGLLLGSFYIKKLYNQMKK